MYVFATGRRMGKTSATVVWFLENPYEHAIIVPDHAAEERMWRSIVSYVGAQQANKAWRDNIIVASDTTYGRRGHRARKFAVDDTEIVLASLLGIPIHALELVTMTGTPLHQLVGIDGRFERDAHAEARRLSMSAPLVDPIRMKDDA